jgi:hypothetical protein
LTDVAPVRFVPVMTTVVPPRVEPVVGVNAVMVGAGTTKVNVPVDVADPPGVLTEILTGPAACGFVTALMWIELVTV